MKKKLLALILAALVAVSGCGSANLSSGQDGAQNLSGNQTEDATGKTQGNDTSGEVDKSIYMDATQDIETRIEALLAQMTLEEKIGQMLPPEQAYNGSICWEKFGAGHLCRKRRIAFLKKIE